MYLDSRVSVFYCRYFYFLFTAKIKKVTEFVVGHDFFGTPCMQTFLEGILLNSVCLSDDFLYRICPDYCMLMLICVVSCRKTQYAFDKCMLEKLGQERPYVGYFSKVRVHHTKRPKPEVHVEMPEPFHKHPVYNPKDPIPEVTKRRPPVFLWNQSYSAAHCYAVT